MKNIAKIVGYLSQSGEYLILHGDEIKTASAYGEIETQPRAGEFWVVKESQNERDLLLLCCAHDIVTAYTFIEANGIVCNAHNLQQGQIYKIVENNAIVCFNGKTLTVLDIADNRDYAEIIECIYQLEVFSSYSFIPLVPVFNNQIAQAFVKQAREEMRDFSAKFQ